MAVHFPLVLLILGLPLAASARRRWGPVWAEEAAPWFLGGGTAGLWVALALGVLAEHTVPHVPAAWRTMEAHEQGAWTTVLIFSALSAAWWAARGRFRGALLMVWALGLLALIWTAHQGAHLVFEYGVGGPS
jgi:uncharacterized membrane protein